MFNALEKVRELVRLPSENEVVEFKEAKDSFDFSKLGRYFSALSNEANLKGDDFAWLVFGVEDKSRRFVNSKYRATGRSLQSLKGEISKKTTSSITFADIYEVEAEPGKRVVLFKIPAAPLGMPMAFDGHYYARNHEELVSLNIEKIERIRLQEPRKDWSKAIVKGATLADLAPEAISKARELFKNKNPRLATLVDEWDDAKFLRA